MDYAGKWFSIIVEGKKMTIQIDENITGKKRQLAIHVSSGNDGGDIYGVTQEK